MEFNQRQALRKKYSSSDYQVNCDLCNIEAISAINRLDDLPTSLFNRISCSADYLNYLQPTERPTEVA